jgi:hypothetical protein
MWKCSRSGGGRIMELELTQLKSMINKMKIEKLVFGSLKAEELTEEFIDKFIDTMENIYNTNIMVLEDVVKKMESKGSEKDGK